jgi:membrane protein DedA with SNARE-associated domain
MTLLWEFVLRHGYGLMMLSVLVEQLGAPIPAVPVLLVMGALAGLGYYSLTLALIASVVAAVLADLVWFELGRRRGESILGLLCRLSLEPDSCVRSTRRTFDRWGPATLVVAKFVPGLSTVAPPLAGSAGLSRARFIWCDSVGSALWAGSALAIGFLLRREVERAGDWLANFGQGVTLILGAPLAGWICWKLWQRQRTMRMLRVARIQPHELKARLDSGDETHIVDLRSRKSILRSGGVLPGARQLEESDVDIHLRDLPRGAHLVFYCG